MKQEELRKYTEAERQMAIALEDELEELAKNSYSTYQKSEGPLCEVSEEMDTYPERGKYATDAFFSALYLGIGSELIYSTEQIVLSPLDVERKLLEDRGDNVSGAVYQRICKIAGRESADKLLSFASEVDRKATKAHMKFLGIDEIDLVKYIFDAPKRGKGIICRVLYEFGISLGLSKSEYKELLINGKPVVPLYEGASAPFCASIGIDPRFVGVFGGSDHSLFVLMGLLTRKMDMMTGKRLGDATHKYILLGARQLLITQYYELYRGPVYTDEPIKSVPADEIEANKEFITRHPFVNNSQYETFRYIPRELLGEQGVFARLYNHPDGTYSTEGGAIGSEKDILNIMSVAIASLLVNLVDIISASPELVIETLRSSRKPFIDALQDVRFSGERIYRWISNNWDYFEKAYNNEEEANRLSVMILDRVPFYG